MDDSQEFEKYGMHRLSKLLDGKINENSQIIYQCSSYGNFDTKYIDFFTQTITGQFLDSTSTLYHAFTYF